MFVRENNKQENTERNISFRKKLISMEFLFLEIYFWEGFSGLKMHLCILIRMA